MVRPLAFLVSLPERVVRAAAALLGGTVHETAQLVLPRLVRRSRFYEATAKNLLRITVELVGRVEPKADTAGELEPSAGRLAGRKAVGNALELGSIAAFGFSPLWLLAAAADATRGTRTYLDALVEELKLQGVLVEDARLDSVDELLQALEHTAGGTARLIDVPPLELQGLRETLAEIREDATDLPSPRELEAAYRGLRDTAAREGQTLLETSAGVGLAFFNAARHVGRQHVLDPYAEDLAPLREEGFATYARRVAKPYADAISRNLDPGTATLTGRSLERLRRRDGG
ncbi:MAG: hypothetical protein ACKVUT_07905 [Gaiella sp.]